jgi:alpha-tubulin suppressor-like RCC1 family protein
MLFTQISLGADFSLGISGGSVYGWGKNSYGVLRDKGAIVASPCLLISGGNAGFKQVSAGYDHCLALTNDGWVFAWGRNNRGQVGDGTAVDRTDPTVVLKDVGVTEIAAGAGFSYAVTSDHSLYSWGCNNDGQLGRGYWGVDERAPGKTAVGNVVKVAAGSNKGIALRGTGKVWWVQNRYLEDAGISGVTNVAAGHDHFIVLKDDGAVWTSYYNGYGQIGNGLTYNGWNDWTQTLGPGGSGHLTDIKTVSAGYYHSAAVGNDGSIYVWGRNLNGEIGSGTSGNCLVPVKVPGVSSAVDVAVSAGGDHFFALCAGAPSAVTLSVYPEGAGTVSPASVTPSAWGSHFNISATPENNSWVFAGWRASGAVLVAEPLLSSTTAKLYNISSSPSTVTACFNRVNGYAWGWGSNNAGQASGASAAAELYSPLESQSSLSLLTQLAAGGSHSLALSPAYGVVYAWGSNNCGQLGNGTTTDSRVPVAVNDPSGGSLRGVIQVSAGNITSMALKADGTVWAWGGSGAGRSLLPSRVSGPNGVGFLSGVTQISAGQNFCAALKADGTVWVWGNGNVAGSLYPRQVLTRDGVLSNITQISAGGDHCLALGPGGLVYAWGSNCFGQLGDGGATSNRGFAAVVKGPAGGSATLADVTNISAGLMHSMALKADGSVYVWGCNAFGQLGNNSLADSCVPVQTLDASGSGKLGGVTQIAAGAGRCMALKADGSVWGWGNPTDLGISHPGAITLPVQRTGLPVSCSLASGSCAGHSMALRSPLVTLTIAVNDSLRGATLPVAGTSQASIRSAFSITAIPTGKNSFQQWTVSGGVSVADVSAAATTATLSADGVITANFLPPASVSVSADPVTGGSVTPSGSFTVKVGESFSVSAAPADKHLFSHWVCTGGAGVSPADSPSATAVMSGDGTITAKFTPPSTLTMALNLPEGGSVTPAAGSYIIRVGDKFSVTAAPVGKYSFDKWVCTGGASVDNPDASSATGTIGAQDGSITAHFKKPAALTMAVSPSSSSGTTVPAAGNAGIFKVNESFSVTATPADKHTFQKWIVSGGAAVADANSASTTAALSADGVITACFLPPAALTMAVFPASVSGTTVPAVGAGLVKLNERFSVTATPADKYIFQKWTVSGGASVADTNSASTTAALSADGSITASFYPPVTLTMSVSPDSSTGAASPAAGKCSVPYNTGFTVTAIPANTYGFLEWASAGGAAVADTSAASTTATLTADGALTAKFAPAVSLTMDISRDRCGTISPVKGVHSVTSGKRLSFSVVSADSDRYIFRHWDVSGGAALADTAAASTTGTLLADGSVKAVFDSYAYLTVLDKDGKGRVTPEGRSKVSQETAISVTAAPKESMYGFGGWTCSDSGVAAVADCWSMSTTVTLTGDCALTSSFALGYWLTLVTNTPDGGTVNPSGASVVPFSYVRPIIATPKAGYKFTQWKVIKSSDGAVYVLDNYTAASTWFLEKSGGEVTIMACFDKMCGGDFDADSKSDLLFFNADGSLVMYYMDGGTLRQWAVPSLGDGEIPIATGDFNGDGCADILTRNKTNDTVSVFLMSGTTVLSSAVLSRGLSDWIVAGTGDFNGDGKCDIIWQHKPSGIGVIYLMDGLSYTNWGFVYESSDTANWQIKAIGDLDGDGKADIIWRNQSTGVVEGYLMNGLAVKSSGQIYDGADPNWRVEGTGDLDGDGKADIIWRNSVSGVILGYLMDGLTLRVWGVIYDGTNPNLRFAGVGDYSGDGKTDMALRDSVTGNVYIFVMRGLSVVSQSCVYDGGNPNWYITGQGESSRGILIASASGPGTVTPSAGTHSAALDVPVTIKAVPASASCRFIGWTVSGSGVIASASSATTTVRLSGDASVKAWFTAAAAADLNGDGKSDILWRNSSNGAVAGWLMSGARSTDARIIFDSDAGWLPAGKCDFNGDGKCDIIWRNSSSGALAVWLMSGLGMTGGSVLTGSLLETVAGVGDFDGDGKADVLKLASDGAVYMELMNGATVISRAKIFEPGQGWVPCGVGDFDGDGKSDILWRHASGTVAMWLMDGVTAKNSRIIFLDDSQGWRPKACGDFNGDGKCDIAWQDASGNAVVWLMSGFSITSHGYIYQGGDSSWQIMESGDYDGDGKADILWRHGVTGQTLIYFMNGASVSSWAIIFDGDTNWTVAR